MSSQASAVSQQESSEALGRFVFPARYARFGAFEADLEREELHQNGQRVRIQSKLFQALLLLVSRAGEIVSREEVRRRLWPDAFLTSLDANVNTTMNKLRQVLGDSPENPVYIATIPRRGYTFVAAIAFCDLRDEVAETGITESTTAVPSDISNRIWSDARLHTFARAFTLLLAGMIVGALLAFAWASSQQRNNSRHSAGGAKTSAGIVAGHKSESLAA